MNIKGIPTEPGGKRPLIALLGLAIFAVLVWVYGIKPVWILVKTKEKQMVGL